MDRNIVILQGRIGSVYKESKTQNGKPFVYFGLEIESKSNSRSTENNYHQTLKVMVFRKKAVDYLKSVGARSGNRCIVFGFMSSFYDEIKGKSVLTNAINADECYIIKTKTD